MDKNKMFLWIAVAAIAITAVLMFANSPYNHSKALSFLKVNLPNSDQSIVNNSIAYLNKSVLQTGSSASLVSYSEESGVIKMSIKITTSTGSNTYDSYVTKDGKLLFPEAFTVDAPATPAPAAQAATPATTASITPSNVPKVANTSLTAFIVSSCPFGLQMQRALANAIQNVPALAKYVTVRYIGAVSGNTITSMHGDGEAQENLRQMCIRQEQPSKYWAYVSCYMQKTTSTMPNGMPLGDSPSCMASTGVNAAQVNACVADPNRGLAYAKADFALDTKYNIQGSPTLVLNGQVIDETPFGGRSAASMLNIICSSSINPPSFCSTKLDTTPATTSFSLTYAGTTATAAAPASTACAPATN